ncbi:MAG: hypothetical protein K8T26_12090 [Lentisphaerae bacterium]|nr:hypothetical protein [Lentisphaerota bacterium]
MSNRVNQFRVGCVLACVAALVGCEYEGSGDSGSWNSASSWVNFSGVYKASSGGVLVSSFTSVGGGSTVTNGVVQKVVNERIGTGTGSDTSYSGTLTHKPIVRGSVSISAGGFDLADNSNGGLSGGGASGLIDYGTGAWSIDLGDVPLGGGVAIIADYEYIQTTGGGGGGSGGDGSGSSGKAIYSFTVFQTGNKIEITDNNGAKYTGQLGSVATTTGGSTADVVQPSVGDSAIAEYTAEGTSAAGVHVMLTGTFQGVVGRGTGTSMFLGDRRMLGTWVEPKITGDINGQASPIGFTTPTAVQ